MMVHMSDCGRSSFGLTQMDDQKPSRLMKSKVENQKILLVVEATALRMDCNLRSELAITRTRNWAWFDWLQKSPETAYWR